MTDSNADTTDTASRFVDDWIRDQAGVEPPQTQAPPADAPPAVRAAYFAGLPAAAADRLQGETPAELEADARRFAEAIRAGGGTVTPPARSGFDGGARGLPISPDPPGMDALIRGQHEANQQVAHDAAEGFR